MVASCWGFASPWPPSPLPDYFPKKLGCGGAELVASAWGLTRPHFMARPSAHPTQHSPPPRPSCVIGTCLGHVGRVFRRSCGEPINQFSPHDRVVEAEGNLNPHKPPVCLLSQCSLSRGDILCQSSGFGVGEVACWGSTGGSGRGVGVEAS